MGLCKGIIAKKRRHIDRARGGKANNKAIYQIDTNGKVINEFDNVFAACNKLNIYDQLVRYYASNEKLFNNTLLVWRNDYKSSTDYSILIKYIKYKSK